MDPLAILTNSERIAVKHGWQKDDEGLWRHADHPDYGYFEADDLCEDWSYGDEL
jgi:hypothetical protein